MDRQRRSSFFQGGSVAIPLPIPRLQADALAEVRVVVWAAAGEEVVENPVGADEVEDERGEGVDFSHRASSSAVTSMSGVESRCWKPSWVRSWLTMRLSR